MTQGEHKLVTPDTATPSAEILEQDDNDNAFIIFKENTINNDEVSQLEGSYSSETLADATAPTKTISVFFGRSVETMNSSSIPVNAIILTTDPNDPLTLETRKQLMVMVLSRMGVKYPGGMKKLVYDLQNTALKPPTDGDRINEQNALTRLSGSSSLSEDAKTSRQVFNDTADLLAIIATCAIDEVEAALRAKKEELASDIASNPDLMEKLNENTATVVDITDNGNNSVTTKRILCLHSHSKSAQKEKADRVKWKGVVGLSLFLVEGSIAYAGFSHMIPNAPALPVKIDTVSAVCAMILMIGVAFVAKDFFNTTAKSRLENNETISEKSMINGTITTLRKPSTSSGNLCTEEVVFTAAPISAPIAKAIAIRQKLSSNALRRKYRATPTALIMIAAVTMGAMLAEADALSHGIHIPAAVLPATEILLAVLTILILISASKRHSLSDESKLLLGRQAAVGYQEMGAACRETANLPTHSDPKPTAKKPLILYNGLMTPENGWLGKEESLQQSKFEAERFGQYLAGGDCDYVFLSEGINKQSLARYHPVKDSNYLKYVQRNQMAGILRLVLPLLAKSVTKQHGDNPGNTNDLNTLITQSTEQLGVIHRMADKLKKNSIDSNYSREQYATDTKLFMRKVREFEKFAEDQLGNDKVYKAIQGALAKTSESTETSDTGLGDHFATMVAHAKQDAGDPEMRSVIAARALNQAANKKLGYNCSLGTFCVGSCKSTNDRTTKFYNKIANRFFGTAGKNGKKGRKYAFLGPWFDDGAKGGVSKFAAKMHKLLKLKAPKQEAQDTDTLSDTGSVSRTSEDSTTTSDGCWSFVSTDSSYSDLTYPDDENDEDQESESFGGDGLR